MINFLKTVAFNLEVLLQHTDAMLETSIENVYITEYVGKDEDGTKSFEGVYYEGTEDTPWEYADEVIESYSLDPIDNEDTITLEDGRELTREEFTTELYETLYDLIENYGALDEMEEDKDSILHVLKNKLDN